MSFTLPFTPQLLKRPGSRVISMHLCPADPHISSSCCPGEIILWYSPSSPLFTPLLSLTHLRQSLWHRLPPLTSFTGTSISITKMLRKTSLNFLLGLYLTLHLPLSLVFSSTNFPKLFNLYSFYFCPLLRSIAKILTLLFSSLWMCSISAILCVKHFSG